MGIPATAARRVATGFCVELDPLNRRRQSVLMHLRSLIQAVLYSILPHYSVQPLLHA